MPDLRLGIVGSLSSGKSALVHRYLTGSYMQEESPEGGRFKKEMVLDGQSYLLLIRDEGGPPELQVSPAAGSAPHCTVIGSSGRGAMCLRATAARNIRAPRYRPVSVTERAASSGRQRLQPLLDDSTYYGRTEMSANIDCCADAGTRAQWGRYEPGMSDLQAWLCAESL